MSFLQVRADCEALCKLFEALPQSLPESPPASRLPPCADPEFAAEEGVWPAYNKAMHAAFGDKDKGLQINERGPGLMQTLKLSEWCLDELERTKNTNEIGLVGLWIDALQVAAKAAVTGGMFSH
ncbi:MAG TPA: hypothetical protein VGO47_01505 [Chlamydiales bacterium]|nr:hypothetical protein [Chlamydiales bacterium]